MTGLPKWCQALLRSLRCETAKRNVLHRIGVDPRKSWYHQCTVQCSTLVKLYSCSAFTSAGERDSGGGRTSGSVEHVGDADSCKWADDDLAKNCGRAQEHEERLTADESKKRARGINHQRSGPGETIWYISYPSSIITSSPPRPFTSTSPSSSPPPNSPICSSAQTSTNRSSPCRCNLV